MPNRLMFEVGVKEVDKKISELRKEFDSFEAKYGQQGIQVKLNLQGAIGDVQALIDALKNVGDTSKLKQYEEEIAKLKKQIDALQTTASGTGSSTAAGVDKTTKSVNTAINRIDYFLNLLKDVKNSSTNFGDVGFDTTRLDVIFDKLLKIRQELQLVKDNNGLHPASEKTANQLLSEANVSGIERNLRMELSYYKQIGTEFEKIEKLKAGLQNVLGGITDPAKQQEIRQTITNLENLQGLVTRMGTNDARFIFGGKEYKDNMANANVLLKESVSNVKAYEKAQQKAATEEQKSVNQAAIQWEKLGVKIRDLQALRDKGVKLGLDPTEINNYIKQIAKLRAELYNIKNGVNNGKSQGLFGLQSGLYTNQLLANANVQKPFILGQEAAAKFSSEVKTATANITQLTDSEQRLANAIKGTSDSMRGQSQVLSDLKTMALQYLSLWGAQSFVNNIIETGGLLEQQRLSLSAILGDMGKAQTLFNQIKVMALKSPFGVVELDKMSKQLAAYSFEYEELFDWTKRLADISAATGTSVDRLALALGHVRSEGALSGYTLRQFAMANVPVLRMLSENLGISSKEVRERVRKKEVSAEDVQDILKQLTDDGGMFANAQETMSEALNAKFKNLRDAFDIMYGEIAESGIGDKLKELAVILTNGAKHWGRLANDIKDIAIAFGICKVAILMYNNALGKGTALTLKSAMTAKQKEIANLQLTASYRDLSIAELRTMANAGKLNATNLSTLLSTKKLTYAELERAVALGKVDKATAMSALRMQGMYKQMNLLRQVAPLQGWARMWAIVSYNIKLAGLALKSFLISIAPLLALTAAFEIWNRRSEQKDNAKDMAKNMAGNARGREAYEMRDSLADSRKLSTEALKQNITEMQNALVAANAYTKELKNQVEATEDLAKKYDLLKAKIGEVSDAYEEQKNSQEAMMNEAWDVGGGFLSDNMLEDTKQFDIAMSEYQKKLTIASKQIKGFLSDWLRNQGEFKDEFATMTGKQIFESISKEMQEAFLNYAWNAKGLDDVTNDMLREISRAYNKVGDKLSEMRGDQGEEFASVMKAMYEEAFKVDLDKAKDEQKIAFDKWLRETLARAEGLSNDAKEALRNIVIDFTIKLVPHYQVEKPQTAEDIINQQIGDNKWLSGFFGRQETGTNLWTVETAQKEVKRYKKLFGDISLSNLDTAPKKLNTLLDGLEETKKNLQNTLKDGLLGKDERAAINTQLNEATQSIELAEKALKDVGGKRKRKGEKSGKKNVDNERAKAIREEMRIMKEAADAFQYWREKVGDTAAWDHVEEEFGDVLNRIDVTAKNIKDLRGNIEGLSPKIAKIKDKKVQNETYKEQAKELSQINRRDFEKTTEEFASKVQIELDSLTRAWEVFNNVRASTGDVELAVRISGADYQGGKTRNLADALREKIQKDFDAAGGGIAFNPYLSDKDIQESIQKAMPQASEKQIKGFIEEYKKWRDLQRDVLKADIQTFSQLLGKAEDYESVIARINSNYSVQKESLDNLLNDYLSGKTDEKGNRLGITPDEYLKALGLLDASTDLEKFKQSSDYINLMNNSLGMTANAVEEAADALKIKLGVALKNNAISAKDYADEMAKLEDILRKYDANGLFGKNTAFASYITGGMQGVIQNYTDREQARRTVLANAKKSEEEIENDALIKKYKKVQDALSKFANGLNSASATIDFFAGILQGFGDAAQQLSDMFDALGDSDAADTMSDIADSIGAITSGAQSLSSGLRAAVNGDVGGLVSGVVGTITSPITAFAMLNDKKHERRIQDLKKEITKIDNTLNTIKSLRERELGYDKGNLRRQLLEQYKSQEVTSSLFGNKISLTPTTSAMAEYYGRFNGGNGYSQEYNALIETRKKYMEMYDEENSKKKKSQDALEEYKTNIAALDEQIMFFTQDLAKELWSIDIQGWAEQIGDALWTAFENGEDAVEAFGDTARDIISNVAKDMWQLSILKPLFKELQETLFGQYKDGKYTGGTIKYDSNGNIDMQASEQPTLEALGQFFGKNGVYQQAIEGGQQFYEWVQKITGIDLSKDSSSSASNSIKSITEQTADLLAAYLNATRASVAKIEIMQAEYLPMYYEAMTRGNSSLANIENHTAAIMRSNDAIKDSVESLYNDFHGLRTTAWKMPIA